MSRRLWLFGALRIEQDGQAVTLGGKLVNLFAYLLLHSRHPLSRERLADLLSPDAPPDRASSDCGRASTRRSQTSWPASCRVCEVPSRLRGGLLYPRPRPGAARLGRVPGAFERLALLSHRQAMLGILERVSQRRADVEEIKRFEPVASARRSNDWPISLDTPKETA
ncbi:MAG: hypothetical protein AB1750_13245 [Chloroflexota bacterium]